MWVLSSPFTTNSILQTVPLFHFYKNGVLLEAFPTRDKERILSAILKYTRSTPLEASPS